MMAKNTIPEKWVTMKWWATDVRTNLYMNPVCRAASNDVLINC